jgi:hypothetical protein
MRIVTTDGVGRTVLLAGTFVAFAACRSGAQAPTICDQPFDGDLTAFAERIRELPHATAFRKNGRDLYGILVRPPRSFRYGLPSIFWYFTTQSHPAHPSVFCFRILHEGGRRSVDSQLRCQAAKEPCEKLAAEFSAQEQWFRKWVDAWQGERVR